MRDPKDILKNIKSNNKSNLDTQIKTKIDYLNSPDYKKRLIEMGEKNPDKLIKERIELLKNTIFSPTQLGQAQTTTTIDASGKEVPAVVLAKEDTDVVKAHEIGHVTGGAKNIKDVYDPFEGAPSQMSPAESWAFISNNKSLTPKQKEEYWQRYHNPDYKGRPSLLHKYSIDIPADVEKGDTHDISTAENKADLDAVRYLFNKFGLTKQYGENITPDVLKKAMKNPQIIKEPHFQRMLKNFGEESIIRLNNIIASNLRNKTENQA